jgi:hypothetical protein
MRPTAGGPGASKNIFGPNLAPNGRQSATLPEANRAEGNVGEARATSAPNPEGPQDSKGRNADWLVRRWIASLLY